MPRFAPGQRQAVLVSSLAAVLCGCSVAVSTSSRPTPTPPSQPSPQSNAHLAIADSENHRVLIYDAPFTTFENASVVLGQPDFTHRNVSNPPPSNGFSYPVAVAVDGYGNLWVADSMGDRVAEFKPLFANGMDANLVMSTSHPVSITFDSKGNLWVAGLYTVMEFTPPFFSGMQPVVTLGSGTYCDPGPYHFYLPPSASATVLCAPTGIAFDSKGDLWVSDFYDLRVLEFVPPFSSGMAASLELGQPASTAFTSNSFQGVSANSLCGPEGLAFDSSGNLWLADQECSRTLEFSPPFSNGMAASLVLGQESFTQDKGGNMPNVQPNTEGHPAGVWLNSNGEVMVADGSNGRVLIYAPPFTNGMNAATVLGVPNMTTAGNTCDFASDGTAANTLCFPNGGATF